MSIAHGLMWRFSPPTTLADAILEAADALHAKPGYVIATHCEVHPLTLAKWEGVAVEGIAIGPHTRVKVKVSEIYVGVEA